MIARIAPRQYHYAWMVVAVAMGSSLLVFGIRSAPTVLIKPLEAEFGWSRSQLSAAIAIGLVFTGLAAPLGGSLMDRFGARRVLVFIPILSWMVVEFGWRTATTVAALLALAIAPLVVLVMRDRPSDSGLLPYGADAGYLPMPSKPTPVREVMGRATRTPEFWLLAGSFFICGASSVGVVGAHFVPHAVDLGYSEVTAASLLALLGSMNFAGTLASGWLTDKHDPRKLLAVYYTLRAVSLFLLPVVTDISGLTVFAVIFGLDYIATVPPTVALCSELFGRENVGTIYGWVFCAHQLGAALVAQGSGLAYDYLGSYNVAFLLAGGLAVLGGLMALRIERPTLPQPAMPVAAGR